MPVTTLAEGSHWALETDSAAYVLALDGEDRLQHCYWGGRLPHETDYPGPHEPGDRYDLEPFDATEQRVAEEAPPWGKRRYKDPAIKLTYPDGTRALELAFDSARRLEQTDRGPGLLIQLRDPSWDLLVRLRYRLVEAADLIERRIEILNEGEDSVRLEQAFSGQLTLPERETYRLTHLQGGWGKETNVSRTALTEGRTVLESRRGTTSHEHNPFFALDDGSAGEHDGEVFFGALAYSGNWKLVFERTQYNELRASGGLNDFDFEWHLDPGESFETPTLVIGRSEEGFGGASRRLHRYQRTHVLPDESASDTRPVLYNSWYATGTDVREAHQVELAERAAELGCELFVVDDGWFKNSRDFSTGVGDWYVDEEAFPDGLDALVDHVHDLGMEFGLWFEPENVTEDSDVYREHPEWVYQFPDRGPHTMNHERYTLNLADDTVKEHVHDAVDRLLSAHDIDYVKWDMNRHISDPGWPEGSAGRDREIWVRHTRALYDILDRLREAHPDVTFESCSGGGGRVDLGILERTDLTWPSDDVDPFDRLFIQEGYSMAYAPKTMLNWVTDPWEWTGREVGIEYAFHVAMQGTLGIGADLTEWSAEQMDRAADLVASYKDVRQTVQNGAQYRLESPRDGPLSAVQYVSRDRDEGVVFAYLHSRRFGQSLPRLRPRGLDPEARYRIENIGDAGPNEDWPAVLSGRALAQRGLGIDLRGDFRSRMIRLERVDSGSS